nr:hypothetical protein Iba_chr03aCG3870 [Ipomoea batatas]
MQSLIRKNQQHKRKISETKGFAATEPMDNRSLRDTDMGTRRPGLPLLCAPPKVRYQRALLNRSLEYSLFASEKPRDRCRPHSCREISSEFICLEKPSCAPTPYTVSHSSRSGSSLLLVKGEEEQCRKTGKMRETCVEWRSSQLQDAMQPHAFARYASLPSTVVARVQLMVPHYNSSSYAYRNAISHVEVSPL